MFSVRNFWRRDSRKIHIRHNWNLHGRHYYERGDGINRAYGLVMLRIRYDNTR